MISDDAADLLVVDHEPFLRDAVAASLRFLGFGVTAARQESPEYAAVTGQAEPNGLFQPCPGPA